MEKALALYHSLQVGEGGEDAQEEAETRGRQKNTLVTQRRSSPSPRTLSPTLAPRAPCAVVHGERKAGCGKKLARRRGAGGSRRNAETRDGKREMLVEQRTSPPHSPTAHCAVERSAGAGENICVSALRHNATHKEEVRTPARK